MLRRGIKEMQAKSLAKGRGQYQPPKEKVTKLLPTRENQGRLGTARPPDMPSGTDEGLPHLRNTTVYEMACITAAESAERAESAEAAVSLEG